MIDRSRTNKRTTNMIEINTGKIIQRISDIIKERQIQRLGAILRKTASPERILSPRKKEKGRKTKAKIGGRDHEGSMEQTEKRRWMERP